MRNEFFIFNSKFLKPRGFTLIELLVVMVIIGLLSTLGVVNYIDARTRARDVQRKANLQQLQSALELYRADQSAYPATLPTCGNPLRDATNTTTYLQKVPCDPTNTAPHTYSYTLTGATYSLRACLENERDAQRDTTNSAPCNGTTNVSYTLTTP